MGKRSDFERAKLDYYPTPASAVMALVPFLTRGQTFCEPCAGAGVLAGHLENHALRCVSAFDVRPLASGIRQHDASWIEELDLNGAELIITNPPWDRPVLHQIIERCSRLRPTWLLFDADWMHTGQAREHLQICRMIVSVGRVKWIEGSKNTGMDNCCWYLFDQNSTGPTTFVGRR
jgi:hypothetical protein